MIQDAWPACCTSLLTAAIKGIPGPGRAKAQVPIAVKTGRLGTRLSPASLPYRSMSWRGTKGLADGPMSQTQEPKEEELGVGRTDDNCPEMSYLGPTPTCILPSVGRHGHVNVWRSLAQALRVPSSLTGCPP